MKINKIVSVCCKKDIETWKTAARYIIQNIESEAYLVIVPDNEIKFFQESSPAHYQVHGESKYTNTFQAYLRAKIPRGQESRYGWYLQQFIKLSAIREFGNDELILIWDSDTVPLKKLSFYENKCVRHYIAIEHHQPYFDFITKLNGLPKKVAYSFISQCLAIKGKWSVHFFADIEKCHGKLWYEAMIDCIDFHEASGFSEYETLGTFIQHHYPDEIVAVKDKWYRYGNARIGKVENLSFFFFRCLLWPYNFVSFENWDRPYRDYEINILEIFKRIKNKILTKWRS